MSQLMARWFTPPSKKSSGQSFAAPDALAPAAKPGTPKPKKKTRTKYAGMSPLGRAGEADVAKKTLLGQ